MAKRIIQELIDDIDGKTADETVLFGLDGNQYQIDLSKKNAAKLRDALAPFVSAGRKIGRGGVTAARGREGRGRQQGRSGRDLNRAIREWAQAQGLDLPGRGRIKQEIVDRYHAESGR